MITDPGVGMTEEEFTQALGASMGCVSLFSIILIVLFLWLFYRILRKAGYSGWLTLLNLLPFGSLILLLVLAFGSWPALRAREATPINAGYPPAGYPPSGQPPVPPVQPGYQPPQPPMGQPPVGQQPPAGHGAGDEPPAPPAPPAY